MPFASAAAPLLELSMGLASYTYATTQIRATITCFYIITQQLLSATKANRGDPCALSRLKWHRHSCLCAVPMWQSLQPWLPHRIATLKHHEEAEAHIPRHKFLIANLELEFKLSPIKINELKFSNRKFLAIFYNTFQSDSTQQPASTISSSSLQPLVSSCQNPRPPVAANRDAAIRSPQSQQNKTNPNR